MQCLIDKFNRVGKNQILFSKIWPDPIKTDFSKVKLGMTVLESLFKNKAYLSIRKENCSNNNSVICLFEYIV